jgi:hypothetical protein
MVGASESGSGPAHHQERQFTSLEDAADSPPEWTAAGFQGENPATDLRGSGMLGMLQLLHLLCHPVLGRASVDVATSRLREFPLALVSLGFSATALDAMRESSGPLAARVAVHAGRLLDEPTHTRTPQHQIVTDAPISAAPSSPSGGASSPSPPDVGGQAAFTVMHDLHCGIVDAFLDRWCAAPRRSIVDFPAIKAALCKDVLSAPVSFLYSVRCKGSASVVVGADPSAAAAAGGVQTNSSGAAFGGGAFGGGGGAPIRKPGNGASGSNEKNAKRQQQGAAPSGFSSF